MRMILTGILAAGVVASSCGAPEGPQQPVSGSAATSGTTAASDGRAADPTNSSPTSATTDESGSPAIWREVTIPAGTTLALVLDTPVASDTSRVEESVQAHVGEAIVIDGVTAVPRDSAVTGVVTEATRAGKVQGRAQVAVRFDSLMPRGQDERYQLQTGTVRRTAPSEKKKDAAKIAVPAAGGAIIGGIVGGKKGAVIGGTVGGGAGTAVVLTDRGQEVRLGKGATISVKLAEPLVVRVRG
jgi:hypothetical protein